MAKSSVEGGSWQPVMTARGLEISVWWYNGQDEIGLSHDCGSDWNHELFVNAPNIVRVHFW